jgi:leucyl-tRNA synthetase
MERYDHASIEARWQAYWDEHATFRTKNTPEGPRAYILDMFPYPSGAGLHVGHPEGYTATDIVARYRRALGWDVLHPMGWDAFGLPAEQYAIQTGTHPALTTRENIKTFKRQLKSLGFSYDWSREIDTTDPAYVKWTQWIFLRMYERGLAYQSEIPVNFCPALGTVLANEEVIDGKSERGGFPVLRIPLRQWILKITAYAQQLLEGFAQIDWPASTCAMQTEWIGRSEGAEVRFAIEGHDGQDAALEIYTTRPDTLYGATFMVLAPEHPLVEQIASDKQRAAVQAYVTQARNKSDRERQANKEKTGVFTGAYAKNPLSGARIPIWIADYVLIGYGTGAIMAVPGHDERDFEFARAFDIPVVEVVSKNGKPSSTPLQSAYVEPGIAVNSGPYAGLTTAVFKSKVIADLEARGIGKRRVEYKLRDWVFSRQRYWGEPIPIYFPVDTQVDPRTSDAYTIRYDQPIALQDSELPLRLPELADFKPGEDPAGVLARAKDWRFFQKDGRWFARETNTMPQWAASCWYYLRFIDPHNDKAAWDPELAKRWLPVDLYVGGAEHSVLHLLYARFWHRVLYDAGLVSTPEPFQKLVHQGMILGEVEYTYYRDASGKPVPSAEVIDGKRAGSGEELTAVSAKESELAKNAAGALALKDQPDVVVEARTPKMSKSRGNVINPDDIVTRFGADSLRVYEMFMGPLEAKKPWSTSSINGVRRFLDRCYAIGQKASADAVLEGELLRHVHKTIQKVTHDIEALRFNTALSALMVLSNELAKLERVPASAVAILAQLLHPFAPHLGEELWERAGKAPSVQHAPWPKFDPALVVDDVVEVPVQVLGKLRGRITLAKDAPEATAVELARADAGVEAQLAGKTIKKVVYVPGKILNFIVG